VPLALLLRTVLPPLAHNLTCLELRSLTFAPDSLDLLQPGGAQPQEQLRFPVLRTWGHFSCSYVGARHVLALAQVCAPQLCAVSVM
jgi:hypothetical protein